MPGHEVSLLTLSRASLQPRVETISLPNVVTSFALAEIYLALAILLRRFNFQLYDTTLERDVVVARDHFIGEAQPESKGVRVKIVSEKA